MSTHSMHCMIAVCFICVTLALAQSTQSSLNFNECCNSSQEATAWAIVYGTPLVSYANFSTLLLGVIGANSLYSNPALSTPSEKAVVKPNVDTLYTASFLDLSQSDLILTVPEINDGRFYVIPFYDPYGDNFASISSINGYPSGDYLIRRADDAQVYPGIELTPPSGNCVSQYKGIINYPTTHGSLLARILVRANTTAEYNTVHMYQRGITITPTPRAIANPDLPTAPKLTTSLLNTSDITSQAEKALTLLARMGAYNQPEVSLDRYRVGSILGQAGISNNTYTSPAGVDLAAAQSLASSSVSAEIESPGKLMKTSNQWVIQNSTFQGNYDISYAIRDYIALGQYLQLVATTALYPIYGPQAINPTYIAPKDALLFTFYGQPPVDGFWSLTAYDASSFLIPNPIDKYEASDRSGLKYSDGTLVYPLASTNSTGIKMTNLGIYENATSTSNQASFSNKSFQVLLQPADVTPPTNWTSNWLPAPAGGGEVQFILRFYAPTSALSNGGYEYPLVQKIAAIT